MVRGKAHASRRGRINFLSSFFFLVSGIDRVPSLGGVGGVCSSFFLRSFRNSYGSYMRIREYLEAKYKVRKPTTMMYVEAKAFGIQYQLQAGWLETYGDVEITPEMACALRKSLEKNATDSAMSGIRILDRAWIELRKTPNAMDSGFLLSKAWKRIRLKALMLHGRRCQCCGASVDDGAVLNVDHIKPRSLFPELALNINNLQVLCGECNEGKGNWCMEDFRSPHTFY